MRLSEASRKDSDGQQSRKSDGRTRFAISEDLNKSRNCADQKGHALGRISIRLRMGCIDKSRNGNVQTRVGFCSEKVATVTVNKELELRRRLRWSEKTLTYNGQLPQTKYTMDGRARVAVATVRKESNM